MAEVLLLYLGDYSSDLHAKPAVVLQEMFFEDMGERKLKQGDLFAFEE